MWILSDRGFTPTNNDDSPSLIDISSEYQLRSLLNNMSNQSPRIVILRSTTGGDAYIIGIGGGFGGIGRFQAPNRFSQAVSQDSSVPEEIVFSFEGQPSLLRRNNLFHASQLVDIIIYIFCNGYPNKDILWM